MSLAVWNFFKVFERDVSYAVYSHPSIHPHIHIQFTEKMLQFFWDYFCEPQHLCTTRIAGTLETLIAIKFELLLEKCSGLFLPFC